MILPSSDRDGRLDVEVLVPTVSGRVPRVMVALDSLEALPGGTERIVVAEDNSILRKAIKRVLEGLGYEVEAYCTTLETLDALSRDCGPIALVLADHDMPALTGYELAQRFWDERPGVRVLLSSCRSEGWMFAEKDPCDWPYLLPKPYDLAALAHRIREVIDGPDSGIEPCLDTSPRDGQVVVPMGFARVEN
jgi:CheY-like chemotaxis protein